MSTKNERRQEFNGWLAATLAASIGCTKRWDGRGADRFAYFADDERLVIVAGQQEAAEVDLALAYGLTYGDHRRLTIILPAGYDFPTLQRAAWLKQNRQPAIYTYDGSSTVRRRDVPAREETIERLRHVSKKGLTLEEEFCDAARPLYLGKRVADVAELVEWATKDPRLDPGHRQGERAWSYMGQKVLSIQKGGEIRAGIHTSKADEAPTFRADRAGGELTQDVLKRVKEGVEVGISARLSGQYQRPDEHWFQAVIRRDPPLIGIEQPALREVPAWRPVAKLACSWSRGYLDLAGLDGHGDLRLVETKLASNPDPWLLLQGLDYYLWARGYEKALS